MTDGTDAAAAGRGGSGGRGGRGGRVAVIVVAIVAIVVTALLAYSFGRISTLGDPTPTDTSAEAGFARDMQAHHVQGVEMAMIVRDATDDADVRLLAYDIATTQAQQSGQLYGWLNEWGLSQAGSEPSMTWMTRPGASGTEHGHSTGADAATHTPGGPMPGMATEAQLTELKGLQGVAAERLFLSLMIAHHQGALEMAVALLDRSTNSVVTTFANGVVASQTAEIELMEGMLAERS
ncbi:MULTISPECIES: DUF305 domain-containing protein [unclassified Leifsonia]|uniref:DUF305 domain-containing protein n=1 Tax=unclassified Leifsonia TaxID=2663824 RepID=UPI0006F71FCE|nr:MULTISPECIES: DUF305 domain-containing protein [unclassified Leifsonia]KQX05497.1 hypothetical protein ASC59_15370 [Leifsonia sp. Root1293]KRA09130.1 hypothetical protein ASD61_15365 [Leifsonia sp. Root60]